jgi:uncharacterized protein YozE (UPF0346 family)
MPVARTKVRYYVHGDLHEERPNTYYCASCDLFVAPEHFADPSHVQARAEKFNASLNSWQRFSKRHASRYYRHLGAKNIIEADAAADLRAAKAAQSPFYRWLLRQTCRNDPIGDLADDVKADRSFPVNAKELRPLKTHLLLQNAIPEALVALDEAWGEFKAKGKARAGLSSSQRFEIFKRDKYRCQICGASSEDNKRLEIDHKIPVAKGGSNEPKNLWVLCFACNRGKSDRDL